MKIINMIMKNIDYIFQISIFYEKNHRFRKNIGFLGKKSLI